MRAPTSPYGHPSLIEAMGLTPWRTRLRQAMVALRGEQDVPPSRFGLSSLRQLHPRIAVPLWRGRFYLPRVAIVTNLFNHRQTPVAEGWSVRKTQVADFRGRTLTYDSHNGTDFSIPVGSVVVAAAPGQVVRVASEFNRGGLKLVLDHGGGLMTCTAHLARVLVAEGQVVRRAEPVAISGYSGLDALVTFPWGTPHIHFNVWLNGEPTDPFPHAGAHGQQLASLWRAGPLPLPAPSVIHDDERWEPSAYDSGAVDRAIAACRTRSVRHRLETERDPALRAAAAIAEMNYYPTRFALRLRVYRDSHPRQPALDLPLQHETFAGVVFADDLG